MKVLLLLSLVTNTLFSSLALADIRYITDVAYVPMRSGAGNDYRIIHYGLKSGLKLNVLEYPDGDWAKVQTPSGREGWIQKQYLVKKPIASDLLEKAQKDFDIDFTSSIMIGDKISDIKAGKNLGMKSILVRTGHGLEEEKKLKSDCEVYETLYEFAKQLEKISKNHRK